MREPTCSSVVPFAICTFSICPYSKYSKFSLSFYFIFLFFLLGGWGLGGHSAPSFAFPGHAVIVSPTLRMKSVVFLRAAAKPHSFSW